MAIQAQPQVRRKKGNGMIRIFSAPVAAALLSSMVVAAPVSAAPLFYSFTPTSVGAQRFTFNVDSNPVLLSGGSFQFTAAVQNVTVNGVARNDITSFDFFTTAGSGGLANNSIGSYLGPQLFSGTALAPTLLASDFALFGGPFGSTGTLNVTAVAAAVPEPGTWAITIVGLGLAGSVLRRRRVTMRLSYAA